MSSNATATPDSTLNARAKPFVSRRTFSQAPQGYDARASQAPAHVLMSQRRRGPAAIAKDGTVPDHFVGCKYRELSFDELQEIKRWRLSYQRCEGCGWHKHETTDCPRLAKMHEYRKTNNLCLECASASHKYDDFPERKALRKSLGRIAEEGEVPKSLVGLPYAMFDGWHKEQMLEYHRKFNKCAYCAASDHKFMQCEKRRLSVDRALERRRKDLATGRKKIITVFTGTLAETFPAEIRVRIWEYLTKQDRPVMIRPGLMNKYMLRCGFPFCETFEGWIRGNAFYIESIEDLQRFDHILTTFKGHSFVRTISVGSGLLSPPLHIGSRDETIESDGLRAFKDLFEKCEKLNKIKISVYSDSIVNFDYNSRMVDDYNIRDGIDMDGINSVIMRNGIPYL